LEKEGLAMGADEAYILSDRAFAGSDSLATSRVLAAGIRKMWIGSVPTC
jgi:electron transfer flavoprotein beta subunit